MDYICKINLHTDLSIPELTQLLAHRQAGEIVAPDEVSTSTLLISIERNDEFKPGRPYDFPDGFLYFRHFLFLTPLDPTVEHATILAEISDLLEFFWERGEPAVAGCDFEHDLPHQGGYKSENVPWPKASN